MSGPVQITFDTVVDRWEIGYADAVGTTVPVDGGDGLWVGRNTSGQVVEIVVDGTTVSEAAMVQIVDTFGQAIAEVVRSAVPGRDLEVQVTANLPARAATTTAVIEGEPGVPVSRVDGGHRVPTPVGDLELRVSRGELRLRLPANFGHPDWWVRVSDGETGDLLALAPVRIDGDTSEASMTFGLDVPVEHLHLDITPRPLDRVGTRLERRTAWVDQLLTQSAKVRRTRPRLAQRLAARARDVALLIGDTERRRRAERLTRRNRLWGLGSMSMVTLVVVVIAGVLLAGRGSAPAPEAVPDLRPGSVGPAEVQLSDGATIDAALVGVFPEFRAGEVVPLSVQVTSRIRWSFGPSPEATDGDVEAARRNCLGVTEQSAEGSTYNLPPFRFEVFLERLSVDGDRPMERVIVGGFEASPTAEAFTSDKDSCRSPEFNAANRFEADTSVRRVPQMVDIALPTNLPAGLWEVTLVGPVDTVAQQGSLRIRVTP